MTLSITGIVYTKKRQPIGQQTNYNADVYLPSFVKAVNNFNSNVAVQNLSSSALSNTGFTFQQPVTLVIDYTDSDVAGLDENSLTLFFYDVAHGVWSDQGITVVARDPEHNRITVQINHLTEFAMGTTSRSYMPVIAK